MKLKDKIAALLQARRRQPLAPLHPGGEPQKEQPPTTRPTPLEDSSLPLDPQKAWGIVLEPREKMIRLLNDFIEQLALEAFLNGPGFEFSIQELESRFLAFFDRLVKKGELNQASNSGKATVGVKRWIEAQQIRINRLVEWWRQQGGPDIEARVL